MLIKVNNLIYHSNNMDSGTTHTYYNDLSELDKIKFDYNAENICPDGYDRVQEMDEWYKSSLKPLGSDKVFETPHLDGPYGLLPYTLLRCIYVIHGNKSVCTVVNGRGRVLTDGEHLMFDYNRDVHYIDRLKDVHDENDRIVYKIHYVKKQFGYKMFAHLNIIWNTYARKAFNKSRIPNTFYEKCISKLINSGTRVYCASFPYILKMGKALTSWPDA